MRRSSWNSSRSNFSTVDRLPASASCVVACKGHATIPSMRYQLPSIFQTTEIPGVAGRFYLNSTICDEFVSALESQPDLFPDLFNVREDSARGTVQEIDTGKGIVVVRRYKHGGLVGNILGKAHWGEGRAIQEIYVHEAAREAGILCPEVIGFRSEQKGLFTQLDLITKKISDARPLEDWLKTASASDSRRLSADLAALVNRMHEAGLIHADFHVRNILVQTKDDGNNLFVLDWDRGQQVDSVSTEQASQTLFRLNRSMEKFGVSPTHFSKADRLRFLKEYLLSAGRLDSLRSLADACQRHLDRHRLWWRLCGRSAGSNAQPDP
jgi:tRNA A-37 threonylcarbamoyl transferase component Bud32